MPGAVQGEQEGIELSYLVHSLSKDQKSPDLCIRRMGSARTSLISQTLSEPAAAKSRGGLSGSSIRHRGFNPVEQGDLVTDLGDTRLCQFGFSRAPTAPPECRHLPRVPRRGHSQTSTQSGNSFSLQPPSPGAWPWGDLGTHNAHRCSALGSRPAELRESSYLGRNHMGLNQKAHTSVIPAALPMHVVQTYYA